MTNYNELKSFMRWRAHDLSGNFIISWIFKYLAIFFFYFFIIET